ncbi:MAG: helix-hairpin-helix domain-containing protein, partial [Bacteroidia bacterium]|nr:helix-hairpin-helix domain-containing protein [Bacteroidia bacterium]
MEVLEYLESLHNHEEDYSDSQNLYETLFQFMEAPLDINTVEYEDLEELQLLSARQINDILLHRENFGDFIAVEELQSIASLELSDLKRIRCFIRVKDDSRIKISLKELLRNSSHELYLKWSRILEPQKGYEKDTLGHSEFLGSKDKQFIRWRSSYENKIRVGLTLEKDPGEPFQKDFATLG